MQYVFDPPEQRRPAVLAISSFDGLHRRHQQLLHETITAASRSDGTPIALLPWPPSAGDSAQEGILTTLGERIALLRQIVPSVDVVVLPAGTDIPWSPETLLERIINAWDVRGVVVDPSSEDALCGRELAEVTRRRAMTATMIAAEDDPMGARIRAATVAGRVAEANELLTREYTLSAEVVGGDRRGRLLGFPTANLRVDAGKVIPANGIYAVRVALPGEPAAVRPAVASVGVRPTFGDGNARLVEVHLLDLSMDLYGVRIETAFVEWLRAEERFASIEALIHQMRIDVEQARRRLAR